MIKIKDIGNFESLPQILSDVIAENISVLENHLAKGWNINEEINISTYINISPLAIALIMGRFQSVKWLVEKGVKLNDKDNPAFLLAARYCDEPILRYLVSHGAKVNGVNRVGADAFEAAYYGKKYENFAIIHELGHSVKQYGGNVLRAAVADGNYQVIDFLIKNGADINYSKANMVYSMESTPLCVAARQADLAMCQYLVKHGAEVTLMEKDGMRPYSIALEKGDMEMATYFKSLEPAEFHQIQNKLDELKAYKLPKSLVAFLQGDQRYFELKDCAFKSIDFFSLVDTVPMKIGRQSLLRLSQSTGDFTHIYIVWNPKTKKVASYDMEHEELRDIGKFEDFIKEMPMYMNHILD